jgi:hypothetical protein
MGNNNHIYTQEFINLSRKLSREGFRDPGSEAMKRMGIEKAVKKKYHDEYLENKMRKP